MTDFHPQPEQISAAYWTFCWSGRLPLPRVDLGSALALEHEAYMPEALYEHDAVDWAHVIEEVEDVGLSELRACQSLLQQAMVHLLKLHAWPNSQATAHWRDEAGTFLDDAARRFTPSMRQPIDLEQLYAAARRRAGTATDDSGTPRYLPTTCPFVLENVLAGDLAALAAKLAGAPPE